jgi:flagellin
MLGDGSPGEQQTWRFKMANQDVTRIASNIGALNSLWALQTVNKQLGVAQTRLSTGKRINSASDDPAGLTIATKLNSRSEGLKVALSNIGDAKNLLAVAEAGVGRITDILVQMKNKASQGASDTMGSTERDAIQQQLNAYAQQIDDIVSQTNWNGNKLIDGSKSVETLSFQTGADFEDKTDMSGLINLSATTVNGLLGGGGLALAAYTEGTQTATASTTTQFTTGVYATINPNISELSSGAYTVRVTYGATVTDTEKIQIFAANDTVKSDATALSINSDATLALTTGAGAVNKSLLIDLSAGPTSVNLGNGLVLNFADDNGISTTPAVETSVTYAKGGEAGYTVLSNGATAKTGNGILANNVNDAQDFRDLMEYLESKLDIVNGQMAKIGAFTGRLEFKEDQVSAAQINVEASYNRIMNANMAEEQVNSSKFQILQQTAIAMLAQANQAPASLLSLFK